MSLFNFLNPKDENEVPTELKITEEVLESIIRDWEVENNKSKTVEEEDDNCLYKLLVTISSKEVVKYFEDILEWALEKDYFKFDEVQQLRRLK